MVLTKTMKLLYDSQATVVLPHEYARVHYGFDDVNFVIRVESVLSSVWISVYHPVWAQLTPVLCACKGHVLQTEKISVK